MIYYQTSRFARLSDRDMENNPIALWSNKATALNVSAPNGTVALFPASNMVTGSSADRCKPTVASGEYIVEVEGPISATALAIASHNIGTEGATVYLEISDNGAAWSGLMSATPNDDSVILFRFDKVSKYYRLRIVSGSQIAIGGLYLGDEMIFEQRAYQGLTPPVSPNQVSMTSHVSEGGELLGSRVDRRGSKFSIGLEHIHDTTVRRDDFLAFMRHFNDGRGFVFAWRPAKYVGDVFFAWRDGDVIAPTNSGPKARMGFNMSMRFRHE